MLPLYHRRLGSCTEVAVQPVGPNHRRVSTLFESEESRIRIQVLTEVHLEGHQHFNELTSSPSFEELKDILSLHSATSSVKSGINSS